EAISNHPEMVLKVSDFSSVRINWDDKALNIQSICKELDLTPDAAVFLDDNLHERERIKSSMPEVTVPELPKDPRLYSTFLSSLSCFDNYSFTAEDRLRKDSYKQKKAEKESMSATDSIQSIEEWLLTLEIEMIVEKLNDINIPRVVQLMNKTNQMNLSTRRLTKEELMKWSKKKNNFIWSFRVTDRFGDAGLVGIASISLKNSYVQVVDFILSCRVMGKKIEQSMLYFLINEAKKMKAKELLVKFKHTKKNQPCLDFWKASEMEQSKEDNFVFNLNKELNPPITVKII
ncbi:FkbH-like protein, partial [Candidatus Thioglobus sp.]|nr:FkbH-like protein [Candidatus Thioglobus sp.]